MSSVNLWEVYCSIEELYKQVWSITPPTVCPDNKNHAISLNPGPKILSTISDRKVKIIEEDGITQGIYKLHGFTQQIPQSDVGNVSSFVHVWNYPITLSNGWFMSTDAMEGDMINCVVAEDTTVGVITEQVSPGDFIITVSPNVISHIYKGYEISLYDGINTDKLGEVIDIESSNSLITVQNSAINNFSPLSPTYVKIGVKVIENLTIPVGKLRYAFAEKKVGGKYIPADIPVVVKYTNNSGNAKVFSYNIEYLY